jgi:hypothetical protein
MEVPAKRARLAPRDLKLLDLDDDALIMIINKLDHESKLQMMKSCKRMEGLIGQTHKFYKNFKFRYDDRQSLTSKEIRYLQMIRRNFGIVELTHGGRLNTLILQFLKKIGAHVLKIKLDKQDFCKPEFYKLMKALPNVGELEINEGCISDLNKISMDFKLEHLIKLKIYAWNIEPHIFAAIVPTTLQTLILKAQADYEGMDWKLHWHSELLGKQKRLVELCLERFVFCEFDFDPENCHIKKLAFQSLSLDSRPFEKFSDFMKIQDSVTDLEFGICEEDVKTNDYTGILSHLLSLKTLKKVTISCEYETIIFTVLSKIQVSNPGIETLVIKNHPSEADLKTLPKIFPCITNLKITWRKQDRPDGFFNNFFGLVIDLKSINSMKNIRKLEMDYIDVGMLAQLNLNKLREFHVSDRRVDSDFEMGDEYFDEDLNVYRFNDVLMADFIIKN